MPRRTKADTGERTRMRATRYIAIATQLPFMIFAGYGFGYALDYWLGLDFLRIIFLLVGVVGGFVQLLRELEKDAHHK